MGLWQVGGQSLDLEFRAFELYPDPVEMPAASVDGEDLNRIEPISSQLGLSLGLPRVRPRTRKAHEASRFGKAFGAEPAFRRVIYEAYWRRGLDIGRIDVLTDLASEVGFDPEELKIALDIDRHEAEVASDQKLALRLRIPGTPVLFLGSGADATVVVGARGPEELELLIHDAQEKARTVK